MNVRRDFDTTRTANQLHWLRNNFIYLFSRGPYFTNEKQDVAGICDKYKLNNYINGDWYHDTIIQVVDSEQLIYILVIGKTDL